MKLHGLKKIAKKKPPRYAGGFFKTKTVHLSNLHSFDIVPFQGH